VTGLTIETAAKINLCLRVLGRRADAYHEVETVLHTVGVWDRIALYDHPTDISITVLTGDVPQGEDNLCWQAASRLAERTGIKRGVSITVEKTIPPRSGLGGGSSDAGATLIGLTRLWALDLRLEELEAIAAELGADVPFFLRGGCCLARGKGEKLVPCPDLSAWLVIVAPERGVSTAQAYAALRRGATLGRRRAPSRPIQRLIEALKAGDLSSVAAALHNDFEAARIAGIDDALRAKADLLAAGCLGAIMSGSGSAVFGIARDRAHAEKVAAPLRANWSSVWVSPTVGAGSHLLISETGEG
jgi:4-diphosphocytidyl-2-C-methyl-D-erythritol kinase